MDEPIFLHGQCKDYLWGGSRLHREFGKQAHIAESWELSAHPDGCSIILNDMLYGRAFDRYLADNPTVLGTNCPGNKLPVLIKLIDAEKDLSVQVHPDDAYAQRVEHDSGKSEMWYVIDAKPGSAICYGTSQEISKAEFAAHIEDGSLSDILRCIPVRAGDAFYIPAGTLHAIGAGILLAEVQQSSNVTYRVFDYGRRDSDGHLRPLHIEKALDVANLTPLPLPEQTKEEPIQGGTMRLLTRCPYFTAYLCAVQSRVRLNITAESFQHLLALDGDAVMQTASGAYRFKKGSSVFLPAGLGRVDIVGSSRFLLTKVE